MGSLDTNPVDAGVVETSSHISTSQNISVSVPASPLRLYFHSGPPLDIPRVNLCHLHVVLIVMHLGRLLRPHAFSL